MRTRISVRMTIEFSRSTCRLLAARYVLPKRKRPLRQMIAVRIIVELSRYDRRLVASAKVDIE